LKYIDSENAMSLCVALVCIEIGEDDDDSYAAVFSSPDIGEVIGILKGSKIEPAHFRR